MYFPMKTRFIIPAITLLFLLPLRGEEVPGEIEEVPGAQDMIEESEAIESEAVEAPSAEIVEDEAPDIMEEPMDLPGEDVDVEDAVADDLELPEEGERTPDLVLPDVDGVTEEVEMEDPGLPARPGATFFDDLPTLDDFDLDPQLLPALPDLPQVSERVDRIPRGIREAITVPQHRSRVEFRRARIKAEQIPSVQEAAARIPETTTDETRRRARREYYELLFNEIRRINPELTEQANELETVYMTRLTRTRIRPTPLLDDDGSLLAEDDENIIQDITID